MTKRRTYNTKPPAVHPKPFQSALWNHLEEIRQMRLAVIGSGSALQDEARSENHPVFGGASPHDTF
jgi:hypothetical protein